MAITAAQMQSIIVLRVGDFKDSLLALNVALLWDSYSDKAFVGGRMQALYTQRDLCDIAIGRVREMNDLQVTTDQGAKLSQRADRLGKMRSDLQIEIDKLEDRLLHTDAPLSGVITIQAPIAPPFSGLPNAAPSFPNPYGPDPNDMMYQGSPYFEQDDIQPN